MFLCQSQSVRYDERTAAAGLKLLMWPLGGLAANKVKNSVSERQDWTAGAAAP